MIRRPAALRVLYATLGELVAWIIGWDLILEYAVGTSLWPSRGATTHDAVARGGISLPAWLTTGLPDGTPELQPDVHGLLVTAPTLLASRSGHLPACGLR